jgi:hypothetical protein
MQDGLAVRGRFVAWRLIVCLRFTLPWRGRVDR